MLPADQRALVEATYKELSNNVDNAGQLFYQRLFELDPSLRPLFKTALPEQGRKLMQTIGVIVAGMQMPDALRPALRELGNRHDQYGVKPEYYALVGEALLWTLQQVLGDKFNSSVSIAWRALYRQIVLMVQQPAQ